MAACISPPPPLRSNGSDDSAQIGVRNICCRYIGPDRTKRVGNFDGAKKLSCTGGSRYPNNIERFWLGVSKCGRNNVRNERELNYPLQNNTRIYYRTTWVPPNIHARWWIGQPTENTSNHVGIGFRHGNTVGRCLQDSYRYVYSTHTRVGYTKGLVNCSGNSVLDENYLWTRRSFEMFRVLKSTCVNRTVRYSNRSISA